MADYPVRLAGCGGMVSRNPENINVVKNMRDCPTVEGSSIPLILHRVTSGDCMARQECNYHKCHRCVFRGKAVDWEPEGGVADVGNMTSVAAREVPKTVEVPRPERQREAAPAAGASRQVQPV